MVNMTLKEYEKFVYSLNETKLRNELHIVYSADYPKNIKEKMLHVIIQRMKIEFGYSIERVKLYSYSPFEQDSDEEFVDWSLRVLNDDSWKAEKIIVS